MRPGEISLHDTGGTLAFGAIEGLISRDGDPSDNAHYLEIGRILREELSSLAARDSQVIRRRFGLDGTPAVTQQQLATELGVTRQRVHSIESKCKERLYFRLMKRMGGER